jgi:glycosyltransferase involved in cell wall biosynthesis
MRVLNVNIAMDAETGGGTAERTRQMSRMLARQGIEVAVLFTRAVGDREPEGLDGVQLVGLPCLWRRFRMPRPWVRVVRDAVARSDIVHLMGHWSVLNALSYVFAHHLGRPHVVCPAGSLVRFGRSRLLKHGFDFIVGRRLIRHASACVAITRSEVNQFEDYGVAAERVTVIANGIEVEAYEKGDASAFRARFDLDERPIVLFVGRLNEIKGPDLLVAAFADAIRSLREDYQLILCGPDEGLEDYLRASSRVLGVESRVRFLGYVGGVDKVNAYHAAALVVIPSRHESMSMVALEAGAAGAPVLLTDRCGFNEIAEVDGGRVVEASVTGLRAGLAEMLANPARLRAMGRNLRGLVAKRYSWEILVEEYLTLYRGILA